MKADEAARAAEATGRMLVEFTCLSSGSQDYIEATRHGRRIVLRDPRSGIERELSFFFSDRNLIFGDPGRVPTEGETIRLYRVRMPKEAPEANGS